MRPSSTIRRGDWKLIHYYADWRFELFDLRNNLGETTNLATEEPERTRQLAKELSDFLKSRGAALPRLRGTGQPVPWPDETENGTRSR